MQQQVDEGGQSDIKCVVHLKKIDKVSKRSPKWTPTCIDVMDKSNLLPPPSMIYNSWWCYYMYNLGNLWDYLDVG